MRQYTRESALTAGLLCRKTFGPADMTKSLKENGLTPSAVSLAAIVAVEPDLMLLPQVLMAS